MAKNLVRNLPTRFLRNNNNKTNTVHGGFPSSVRSFSSSGFPFLNLSTSTSSSSVPVSASPTLPLTTSYAAQFLSASKAGKFAAAPRNRTATATAVEATPLPVYPCEKSAVDRQFEQLTRSGRERPFFVNDVGVVERQYNRWVNNLPGVRPFYAVKCNPDTTLLRTLHSLGAGFDCASGDEMAACLALGTAPEDIIFANPIKNMKDLKFAAANGVKKMTFDNEAELYKIKEFAPESELVLRLLADDSGSRMKFGVKFGAPGVQVEGLLKTAKALGLNVIGTSFHIGSGCFDANSYAKAIALSRSVYDLGAALGFQFNFVDLGGGFPGNPVAHQRNADGTPAFEEMADVIRSSLAAHFPAELGVQVIGEPGRYMATAWSTLFVLVQGKREEPKRKDADGNDEKLRRFLYYINDGVYGSFNNIMYDHAHPEPVPAYRFMEDKLSLDRSARAHAQQSPYLASPAFSAGVFASMLDSGASASVGASARGLHTTQGRDRDCMGTFFGPTCDSLDVVATDFPCEELFVGDWLGFEQCGAYTNAAATTFNGMHKPTVHYCRSRMMSPRVK